LTLYTVGAVLQQWAASGLLASLHALPLLLRSRGLAVLAAKQAGRRAQVRRAA